MILAAVALGLLIGVAMGALGGGGSILTVPALVYVLGLTAQEATTASLVIVGTTAAAATVSHARSQHTRWGAGALLASVGVPAALLGTALNRQVDPDALLLSFALVMLLAAVGMLVQARGEVRGGPSGSRMRTGTGVAGTASVARGRTRAAARLCAAGLGIGFLTGFLGVGGGFVVVPVLVVLLHIPMPTAVGTSLLVISVNSAVALAARTGQGSFVWAVIAPFTVAAVAASLAGERASERLGARASTVSFAVLLVAVAAYVAIRAGRELA